MIDGCSNDRLLSVHETLGGPVDDVVEGVAVDGSPRLAMGLSTVDDPPTEMLLGMLQRVVVSTASSRCTEGWGSDCF